MRSHDSTVMAAFAVCVVVPGCAAVRSGAVPGQQETAGRAAAGAAAQI